MGKKIFTILRSKICVYLNLCFRYDIVHKQAITAEDMFLQMGNKTPSSASCEDMVVSDTLIPF